MYTYQDFKNWVEQNPARKNILIKENDSAFWSVWKQKFETNPTEAEAKWSSSIEKKKNERPYVDDSNVGRIAVAIKYWLSELDEAKLKNKLTRVKQKLNKWGELIRRVK